MSEVFVVIEKSKKKDKVHGVFGSMELGCAAVKIALEGKHVFGPLMDKAWGAVFFLIDVNEWGDVLDAEIIKFVVQSEELNAEFDY